MKKLLEILGTTTIAGSGMAGIVANSPYPTQEQETKLENINYKRQKRNNNEIKIVIRTNRQVWSLGIVFNDKLYFGSRDYNVYEYEPVTEQKKLLIRTNNKINYSGVFLKINCILAQMMEKFMNIIIIIII